jgi:hypothetical protein
MKIIRKGYYGFCLISRFREKHQLLLVEEGVSLHNEKYNFDARARSPHSCHAQGCDFRDSSEVLHNTGKSHMVIDWLRAELPRRVP